MQSSIPVLMGGENRQIISPGNHLPDKEIADALPLRSLTPIEGENETGKSVFCRGIMDMAIRLRISVPYFTTMSTTRSFTKQMKAIRSDISEYFALRYFKVFPHNVVGFNWNKEEW